MPKPPTTETLLIPREVVQSVLDGAPINAVGADAPGKRELHPGILDAAREIAVFDSTGLAVHAIAAARFVFEACRRAGPGRRIRFFRRR